MGTNCLNCVHAMIEVRSGQHIDSPLTLSHRMDTKHPRDRPLRILFAASEAYPLVKTGGLADVAAALPAALNDIGVETRLLLPAYPEAMDAARDVDRAAELGPLLGGHSVTLFSARMPDTDLPLLLLDCPPLFARRGNPYTDAAGNDWPDNHLRFATLSLAAARIASGTSGLDWRADVLHANDWQTGLAPAYLRMSGAPNTRSVFTIHNMRYQGLFPAGVLAELELPRHAFGLEGLEFHGHVSMLKAGLAFCDRITTVSPTYAGEIRLPEFGYGMEGLLTARAHDLSGVLNGIDERAWNPATDPHIPAPYNDGDLSGKAACKTALQRDLELDEDTGAPLISMVTRLTAQKGVDLVIDILGALAERGIQVAILGAGDAGYEHHLRTLPVPPGRIATRIGYDETLAHRLIAGADMFLMPSRFEPCGLTQMYAMRYGTLPIARRTGGLADKNRDISTSDPTAGTGFLFDASTPDSLLDAVLRAVRLRADETAWRLAQRRAMQQDFSWSRAAEAYRGIYGRLAPAGASNGRAVTIEQPETGRAGESS